VPYRSGPRSAPPNKLYLRIFQVATVTFPYAIESIPTIGICRKVVASDCESSRATLATTHEKKGCQKNASNHSDPPMCYPFLDRTFGYFVTAANKQFLEDKGKRCEDTERPPNDGPSSKHDGSKQSATISCVGGSASGRPYSKREGEHVAVHGKC